MVNLYHIGGYIDSLKSQLVFSNSYLGLENYLSDLSIHFRKIGYKGNIIIDLLLSNGKSKNRYLQIFFDGENFDLNQVNAIKPNKGLEEISLNYYANNPELLEDSILNKSQAYLIRNKVF